jgi:hypothetical protein
MKFSSSKLTKQKEKEEKSDKAVLFICVENAGKLKTGEDHFQ